MRDVQVRKGRLLAVAVAICAMACAWAAPALASPPTVTIEGSGPDGFSPSSVSDKAAVNATLSAGVATGTLETVGKANETSHSFKGAVTCMAIDGAHVTIGALGTDQIQPTFGPPKAVPGEFAQLLTVEFGKYTDPFLEESPIFTDRFGGMLGEHNEGVESSVAPNCAEGVALSSSTAALPTFGGVFHLSPSINSPKDGAVSENGTVTLSGTGEPNTTIWVYEEGEEPAAGTAVTVNAEGAWSLAVEGLSTGVHVFSAIEQSGSKVPSNTVEVEVVSPAGGHRHHHHHHKHHHHHEHGGELSGYGARPAGLPAHPRHR
jgi:hypothetical protein